MAGSTHAESGRLPESLFLAQPSHSSDTLIGDPEKYTLSTVTSPTRTSRSSFSHKPSTSHSLSSLEHALTATDPATDAEQFSRQDLSSTWSDASLAATGSRLPSFEVKISPDDPEHPLNWPLWYRGMLLAAVSYSTWTVIAYSTSYISGMPGMMEEFGVTSKSVATVGVTTYLLGLAVGTLVIAPLSEIYGRRIVYVGSLGVYCLLILPCALATSLSEVLIFRFFSAVAGSAMIANSPGSVSDIFTENYRALAFSVWSIGPLNGPVTGPLIGGFAAELLGWRWTHWLIIILAGAGWVFCSSMQETYAPILLQRKAARIRKETGDGRWWCRYDQRSSPFEILKINLSKPLILSFTEPILWFWNAYVAILYGILFLCIVAYPLIFTGLRGWSIGMTGLAYMGIAFGNMLAIVTEPLARRVINSHQTDPATGRVYPEASISVVCLASILCPIGSLWFSWTSVPTTIHWIWPVLAGILSGAGNTTVFVYSAKYVAGSYGIYAPSALAGNSIVRYLAGGILPLAGPKMFAALTPHWAGTLLALVQMFLIPIPFVFYKRGDRIRARSALIKQMRDDQERVRVEAEVAAKRRLRKETEG
ncbi:hypothetical protein QTJ16_001929 [Diplocarpon rosae]|uniref:Major facilitator superfamily (MFS) profile domain-containing protein n=1 Tax=Diplocarpon rosae TaxID=946125 RepID=A0AAD9T420_9HELO|nr:hypothetical protein QTJ16_001929 [Diplocarpon rosae]